MDQHQADQYIMVHLSKLQPEYVQIIRDRLLAADNTAAALAFSNLKDPTIVLILSIFLGAYGIDRFFLGDIGLGVIKLLTLGGCGIWWFIDLFMVMGTTRQKNTEKVLQFLNFH